MKEGVKIRSGSQLLEIKIIESKKVNISDLNELLETGLAISILTILLYQQQFPYNMISFPHQPNQLQVITLHLHLYIQPNVLRIIDLHRILHIPFTSIHM